MLQTFGAVIQQFSVLNTPDSETFSNDSEIGKNDAEIFSYD